MKKCRECGRDIFSSDRFWTIDDRSGYFCSDGCARKWKQASGYQTADEREEQYYEDLHTERLQNAAYEARARHQNNNAKRDGWRQSVERRLGRKVNPDDVTYDIGTDKAVLISEIIDEVHVALAALEKKLNWKFSEIWGNNLIPCDSLWNAHGNYWNSPPASTLAWIQEAKGVYSFSTDMSHGIKFHYGMEQALMRFTGDRPPASIAWEKAEGWGLSYDASGLHYIMGYSTILTKLDIDYGSLVWIDAKNGWRAQVMKRTITGKVKHTDRGVKVVTKDAFVPWKKLASVYTVKAEHVKSSYQAYTFEEYNFYLAHTLFLKGRYAEAIAEYTKAITINKGYSAAYSGRGASYVKTKEYDKAIADLSASIKLSEYTYPYRWRAEAFLWKGKFDEAIADSTAAIKLFPQYSEAFAVRGAAYIKQGKYRRAIEDLEKAIELDSGNEWAKDLLDEASSGQNNRLQKAAAKKVAEEEAEAEKAAAKKAEAEEAAAKKAAAKKAEEEEAIRRAMPVFCGDCGAQNAWDDIFCCGCGFTLQMKCPGCGAEVAGDKKFCLKCGADVSAITGSAAAAGKAAPKKIETVYCSDCGGENTSEDTFCADCGADL
ncbi:MAG: tetratricopeptide repeat protein [Treponema sp.]|nr:tetratricopeptide repeat protein [Treponema sp.]